MKVTINNIHAHELIGRRVKIIESRDPTLLNLSGEIVYETKNMLFIKDTNNIIKKVAKNIIKLQIFVDNETYIIDGKDIVGRPEDRIKRLR